MIIRGLIHLTRLPPGRVLTLRYDEMTASPETERQWGSGALVPAALRAICERARAADPADRYQTVSGMAADVANYLDALPVAAHVEGIVERARRVALRHRTAILLVLAYLVMRIVLLIFTR